MLATILVNLCAVVLSYLAGIQNRKHLLIASFALLFIFLALRYDFGNDYRGYYYIHQDSQGIRIDSLQDFFRIFFEDCGKKMEIGYILLNRITPNFFLLAALVSFLNCYAFYTIIHKYVPPHYWWLSVFLYVFNPFLMLVHSSAIRQSIVISIFMLSAKYLIDRKPWQYFLAISISCLFHYSAIVLLPLYFIITTKNVGKIGQIILGVSVAAVFCFAELFWGHLQAFSETHGFDKYTGYLKAFEMAKFGTGLGFLFLVFIFFLVLCNINNGQKNQLIFTRIYALYFMVCSLSLYVAPISRIGMYFSPAALVSMPFIISNIKQKSLKMILILFLLGINLYSFHIFFNAALWQPFFNYKTIFSLR